MRHRTVLAAALAVSTAPPRHRAAAPRTRWSRPRSRLRARPVPKAFEAPFSPISPEGGGASVSDDLAYSFGALTREGIPGFYAHLWTRDAAGAWSLAVAIWYDAAG